MATSQSQSEGKDLLEDIKNIIEKVQASKDTITEKDNRSAMYMMYSKIEKIIQLADGQVIYDWDEYFMNVACLASLRSEDPRTPVRYCHYYAVK